jgi:hypothetical protein
LSRSFLTCFPQRLLFTPMWATNTTGAMASSRGVGGAAEFSNLNVPTSIGLMIDLIDSTCYL